MPADYPLENLGPEDFQRVAQALLLPDYPDLQVLPVAQPDGGRDGFAFFVDASSGRRDSTIFQVKFKRRPFEVADARAWVLEVIDDEIEKVSMLAKQFGATEYRLITNVPGTSHFGTGSIDKAQKALDEALDIPASCWWRDDVVRRLDLKPALHWAYPQLLTSADVLKNVVEAGLTEDVERRTSAIRGFLVNQHNSDFQVRFRQVELEIPLLDLFIDVPTSLVPSRARRRRDRIRQHTMLMSIARSVTSDEAAEDPTQLAYEHEYHRASFRIGAASLLLDPTFQAHTSRIVMEGAPGQGKSTLAQYLCQIHRMRLLRHSMDDVTEAHRMGAKRLPFKVDLRDYSLWLRKENPFVIEEPVSESWQPSIEAFLAAQIAFDSGGVAFSVADLVAVVRLSSVLLVLDGLDEVADIPTRTQVVEELTKGVNRLEEHCLSLQVVVTSRPAAFANSPGFSPKTFQYLELESITPALITDYSERWLKARRLDPGSSADVRRTLKTKLNQPHMRDLARNPMQLAILLSLIHTRGASLPDKRTALYDAYVDTFFAREAEKSPHVRENRDLLIDIHRYIAWLLHSEAEMQGSDGRITNERLREVVTDYLEGEGHDLALVESIFDGMVQRVVALVSRVEGTYEFEVQPLREYFAARHLYETSPYAPPGASATVTRPDRFEAVIRDRYWLNVARFFAGCFSKGELASLIESVRGLIEDPKYRLTAYPRQLAWMLLTDWVFAQSPRLISPIVDLMADDLGLLHLSRAGIDPPRSPLELPAKSGREQLAKRALQFLDDRPAGDLADAVARLARQNSPRDDLFETWWKFVTATDGERRTLWIRYGLLLGVLHLASDEQLDALLVDSVDVAARLAVIVRAGHTRYVECNEVRSATLVQSLVEARLQLALPDRRTTTPLLGLTRALRRQLWGPYGASGDVKISPPDGPEPPATRSARVVAEAYSSLAELGPEIWYSDLEPWTELIETCRREFGDCDSLLVLATFASSTRSGIESSAGGENLFDVSQPLAIRARYARLRAGAFTWWEATLTEKCDAFHERLRLILCLSWAGPKTLPRLLEQLNSLVDSLDEAAFVTVSNALDNSIRPYDGTGGSPVRIDRAAMGGIGPRLASLLAFRTTEETRRELHDRCVAGYKGTSVPLLQSRVREELRPAQWRTGELEPMLRLANQTRTVSTAVSRFYSGDTRTVERMPLLMATEIAEQPIRFPAGLVAIAEAAISRDAVANVSMVGTIAADEEWFG